MSSIDDVIRERLQKLRASDSTSISPDGVSTCSNANLLLKQPKASASEQVEDLLVQLSAEVNLEANSKKSRVKDIDTEIRSRLDKLKSREGCNFSFRPTVPGLSSVKSNDIHDEDFFKDSSCWELLSLSDHSDKYSSKSCDSDSSDSENLNGLCVVCDKTASLICLGCDKDFYCKTCFKEFHSSEERHKTVPFSNKK